jgi:16S rRNA C967 or C1407 C5-methylase (RsmB/RsmF family)/NOL1/NOP2/fmu family ribosome biogenesis protein
MTADSRKPLPLDQISAALGSISVPGQLSDFVSAITQRKENVMRCRREINADDLPLSTTEVDWYRLGRRPIDRSARPSRYLAYAAADYYVQDAGSLLALAAVDADNSSLRGLSICDLCAAPGGKASALVEAIGESGFVLANEVIRGRMGALQLNLARTGSDRYAVSNLDPTALADRLTGVFDVVVVDAPSSGQAMLARGRQQVSSLSPHQIEHSARRQQRILDAAARLLRSGGRLVYSTCTFAEAENEAQAKRLIDAGVAEPDAVDRLAEYETSAGCYRLWPHLHDCAGSFAASMIVAAGGDRPRGQRTRRKRDASPPIDLSQWYDLPLESTRLQTRDSVILAWPDDAPAWVEEVAMSGPELAHRAGRTWKPAHSAALRRRPHMVCSESIDIDDETAKGYLRGEPIGCDRGGWQIVRLDGRPLGWIKGHGSVGKNHLPAAARSQGEWI